MQSGNSSGRRSGFRDFQLTNPSQPTAPARSNGSRNTNTGQQRGQQRGMSPTQPNTYYQGSAQPGRPHGDRSDRRPEGGDPSWSNQRHAVVGRMQREGTMTSPPAEFEPPKYANDIDLVFETFYHQDGNQYTCMYQNKERFVVEPRTQETREFPKRWFSEGILVTDQIFAADGNKSTNHSSAFPPDIPVNEVPATAADDRAGFIMHPTKGRLQTYIIQEKRNLHQYFDIASGEWIPLPLSWELHCTSIKALLSHIQEAMPDWKDQHDMLAALRASNYNPDACVGNYYTIGDVDSLSSARNPKDAKIMANKDKLIRDLNEKVKALEARLKLSTTAAEREINYRQRAEANASESRDQAAMVAAQLSQLQAALSAMHREKTSAGNGKHGTAVDRRVISAMALSTKELHREQINLRQQVKNAFADLQQIIFQLSSGVGQVTSTGSGESAELNELKELYRREALQRKLLYNQLQELRGNIRVFCRCRHDNRSQCALQFPSDTEVLPPGVKKAFTFDKVFTPHSTQHEVYEDTKPIITSCVDGYNVCILAYGQTGSGKTHTMQGPPEDPGVNVRSIQNLLHICTTRENVDYTLTASMVEIYNETIYDLLSNQGNQLEIRAQGSKIVLPGVVELGVRSAEDIDQIMRLGNKNRTTAATKMNSHSSRSHLIFMITVKGMDRATGSVSTGTLTLCDLAGSERVSKSEATGQRLVEAASINKSLSSLGQVFTALRTGQLHIPYRNSKLTHILQPSLGGDAKACLFVMTSPDASNVAETISSLQFGSNAQQVALGQAKKNIVKGRPDNN